MIKRVAIILLLLCSVARGVILYPSQDATMNWSAAEWSVADNNAKNHVAPIDGDEVIFTANSSATITLDADQIDIELVGFDMTGYAGTFIMGSNDLDVDGFCALDGTITATSAKIECSANFAKITGMTAVPSGLTIEANGTGNVYCSGITGGQLVINTAATHTATDAGFWESFTLIGGTYVDGGLAHTIAGSIVASGGVLTSTATWTMTNTGDLNGNSSNRIFSELIIGNGATFTATLTNQVFTKKATLHENATLTGAQILRLNQPAANDFLDMQGSVSGNTKVDVYLSTASRSNSKPVKAHDLSFYATDDVWTQSGIVTVSGTTAIYGVSDNTYASLVLGVSGCGLGTVRLGHVSDADRDGRLDLGDGGYAVAITSAATGTATQENQLDFGDSIITLSGTIDGDDIACTTSVGAPRANQGTISNVDLSADTYLDARGVDSGSVLDGGGNIKVRIARGLVGGGVF